MAWFISDNHFNHAKIIEYCSRPFANAEEMNKYMIKQWNSVVGKHDQVYHLGDFALQCDKDFVENLINQLNGNIILILGNHDRHGKQWFIDCGFTEVYKNLKLDNYLLTHRPQTLDKLKGSTINIHGHIHNYDRGLDKKNISMLVAKY